MSHRERRERIRDSATKTVSHEERQHLVVMNTPDSCHSGNVTNEALGVTADDGRRTADERPKTKDQVQFVTCAAGPQPSPLAGRELAQLNEESRGFRPTNHPRPPRPPQIERRDVPLPDALLPRCLRTYGLGGQVVFNQSAVAIFSHVNSHCLTGQVAAPANLGRSLQSSPGRGPTRLLQGICARRRANQRTAV